MMRVAASIGIATVLAVVPSISSAAEPSAQAAISGIAPGDDILDAERHGQTLAEHLDTVVESGATWLRISVNWCWIEQAPGDRAKDDHWADVDRVVEAARSRGLKILGIVRGNAVFNRPTDPGGKCDPEIGPTEPGQQDAFADFAEFAAARYRGRIDTWEVWNEPNLTQFWSNNPNPTTYAELLVRTGPAIRRGNPGARILTGGTGGGPGDTTEWYAKLYDHPGIRDAFDVVAVHPYVDVVDGQPIIPSGQMYAAGRIRDLVAARDPGTPMWATEVGLSTGGTPVNPDSPNVAVSEQAQAEGVTALTDAWNRISPGSPIFYYSGIDSSNHVSSNEGFFGLVRADGTPKPAFNVLKQRLHARGATTVLAADLAVDAASQKANVTLFTLGEQAVDQTIMAVRGPGGQNLDLTLSQNTTLRGGDQVFSGSRDAALRPGTYTYWFATRSGENWTEYGPRHKLVVP